MIEQYQQAKLARKENKMFYSLDELRDYVAQLRIRLNHIQSGDIPESDVVETNETIADYLMNEIEMITNSIEHIAENSITFE